MEFFTKLLESMDGNVIEYCILGGIVILVIILIFSIVSCIKSLGDKDSKRKYSKIDMDYVDDDINDNKEKKLKDPVQDLINVAIEEKKLNSHLEVKEENKVAEKIEIAEKIECIEDVTPKEEKRISKATIEKLDINSITREMKHRLEEEEIIDIDTYEDEQEKTAIISYKELLEAAAKIEANSDNEEEYIEDVVFEFNSKKIIEEEQPKHAMKKFRPTIDISPVFGARRLDKYSEQDDLLKIEEVTDDDQDVEQRESFLQNLQDFRKNLD